jgi:lipid-A-disaccharide synthase
MKKVVIVAGDQSGDLYGGLLAKKLKGKYNSLSLYSFGGDNLAQNSTQKTNLLQHSVSGIFEVATSFKKILNTFNYTYNQINKIKPDLIILIDFPDFNLRLAKKLNNKFPIFYYVSPQLWAWREKRIKTIKQYVEKMVVIFKFEQEFYQKHNMPALYFGHPLLEIIPPLEVEPKKIISFLPGSRKNEIKKHLPIIKDIVKIIKPQLPNFSFQVIRAENIEKDFYYNLWPEINLREHSYRALAESKFILSSSGTATLEIAILETPYAIIYKLNCLSWYILKKLVNIDYVGIVNILSDTHMIPEFIQKKANPVLISSHILSTLRNEPAYKEVKQNLKTIKQKLTPYHASENFANYIGEYLRI